MATTKLVKKSPSSKSKEEVPKEQPKEQQEPKPLVQALQNKTIMLKLGSDDVPIKPVKSFGSGVLPKTIGMPKIEHDVIRFTNDTDAPVTETVCIIPKKQTEYDITLPPHTTVKVGIVIKPEPEPKPKPKPETLEM